MDSKPKLIAAWAGAVTAICLAVGAVVGGVSWVERLVAQEASDAATAAARVAVEQEVRPIASTFEKYLELQRRDDDRAERDICQAERVEFPEGDRRSRRCSEESDYRWLRWAFEDCVDQKGAEGPSCVEPEPPPRVESQRR